MLSSVLMSLLDASSAILQQAAFHENIGLKNVSISLVIILVVCIYLIRWLTKSPKRKDDKFGALPDECVLHIFQHLSISDLKRSAQVCRQFDRVSKDEKLWYAFCQRDFRVRKKERPVWLATWHDFYVYHFKYMTSLNILWVLGTYWRVAIRKSRYIMILFLMMLPFLLGVMTILFLHYSDYYITDTRILAPQLDEMSTESTVGGLQGSPDADAAAETLQRLAATGTQLSRPSTGFFQSWQLPNCSGDTCVWLFLIGVAVSVLVYVLIPIVSFILSFLEPVFIYIGLRTFGSDENNWKYMEEHKTVTVLLGATLLTTVVFGITVALLAWKISKFAKLHVRTRRSKFINNLKKNWNDFRQTKSRQLRKRLREVGLMDERGRIGFHI